MHMGLTKTFLKKQGLQKLNKNTLLTQLSDI